jgi:hypothetical protein
VLEILMQVLKAMNISACFLAILITPALAFSQSDKIINIGKNKEIDLKNSPRINFKVLQHDFGVVEEGKTVNFDFSFVNTGGKNLRITDANPDCKFVTVEKNFKEVVPGGTGYLKIYYDTKGRSGRMENTVIVRSNDPFASAVVLKLGITIEREMESVPSEIFFAMVKKGTTSIQSVKILGRPGLFFKVLLVSALRNAVIITKKPRTVVESIPVQYGKTLLKGKKDLEKRNGVVLTLTLSKNLPVGKALDEIIVKTDNEKMPEIRIPVSINIVGRVQTFPNEISLENKLNKPVTLRVFPDPPQGFSITKISTLKGLIKVIKKEVKHPDGRIRYDLSVNLEKVLNDSAEDEIVLWTNDKEEPKVTVPVKIVHNP